MIEVSLLTLDSFLKRIQAQLYKTINHSMKEERKEGKRDSVASYFFLVAPCETDNRAYIVR